MRLLYAGRHAHNADTNKDIDICSIYTTVVNSLTLQVSTR